MPSILVSFVALVGIILAGSALWAVFAPARDQVPGLAGSVVNVMALTAVLYAPILMLALTQGIPIEAAHSPCLFMAALAGLIVVGSRQIA